MINAFSATPFNLLSHPNPHLPQRYGYNEPVRSSSSGGSHSSSRPLRSTSSVHFERNLLAQGYGATSRGYNPTSRPAPLNPEQSGVQVQINGSRGATVSTERSASPRKTSATSEASAIPGPPHLHLTNSSTSFPAPPSPSPRPPITTRSTSSNSMLSHSNSGSRSTPRTPRLGVQLVRPLPYGPSTSTRGRGRPQVKETRAAHTSSGTNSPTGTSSPTLAITSHPPPPSPHSSEHSLSPTFSTPFVINIVSSPTFEIRDVGSVVVGWDSD